MGHTSTKKIFIVYLKSSFKQVSLYILSGNPIPSSTRTQRSHGDSQLMQVPGCGLAVTREQNSLCLLPTGDQVEGAQTRGGGSMLRPHGCSHGSSWGPRRRSEQGLGDVLAGDSWRTRAAPQSHSLSCMAHHEQWKRAWTPGLQTAGLCPGPMADALRSCLPAPPFPSLHSGVPAVTSQGPLGSKGNQEFCTQ